ncbi:MAG: carbohydrate kinase family protein [Desulfomonilaceae bacterium]
MALDVIGFGSLNLDEFWEVSREFLKHFELQAGHEYVRDSDWFRLVYPKLKSEGILRAMDPGGSAANAIAALRRMGFSTGFFGTTGTDTFENMRLNELGEPKHLRVDTLDAPGGRCLCLINSEDVYRDRCLVILPNANDFAGANGFNPEYFGGSKWVHMTSFSSRSPLDVQKKLVDQLPGTTKLSFDPGAIYSRLGIDELLPILKRSNVLFATEEELLSLTRRDNKTSAIEVLFEIGVKIIVLKLGIKGIEGFTKGFQGLKPAIKPSAVVDRTGAGDVAAAGFLAGLLNDLTIEESLELAAAAASRSIEGYGRSAYPDKLFLTHFLKNVCDT